MSNRKSGMLNTHGDFRKRLLALLCIPPEQASVQKFSCQNSTGQRSNGLEKSSHKPSNPMLTHVIGELQCVGITATVDRVAVGADH